MTIDDLIEIEERLVVGKFKQKFYANLQEFDDPCDEFEDYCDEWWDQDMWDKIYAEEVAAGLYEDAQCDSYLLGCSKEDEEQYYRELDAMYEDECW